MAEIATSRRIRASVIADRLAVSRSASSGVHQSKRSSREHPMLYALATILFVLWFLAISLFRTAGGMIHLLLVLAIAALVWHFVSGRKLA